MAAPSAVDRFLHAIETATIPACEAWAGDATLDATVPNWRLHASGPEAIRSVPRKEVYVWDSSISSILPG